MVQSGCWRLPFADFERILYGRTLKFSYPVKVLVAHRSGNCCAFPGCSTGLTLPATAEAEAKNRSDAAHILGEKPDAARYDPDVPAKEVQSASNCLFLCPSHHREIDNQPERFPVEALRAMKREHEAAVQADTEARFTDVTSRDLARVTAWVRT